MSVFVDGSVLNDRLRTLSDVYKLTKSSIQKVDLKVKRPPLHVFVEVIEVRIAVYILKMCLPLIMFPQQSCERGLAGTNIAGYGYVFPHDL
jgi:hypothetical protein